MSAPTDPDDTGPDDDRSHDGTREDADAGPDDPLATASPRRLGRIARRADRLRRRRPQALEGLAERLGIEVRRLRLLADAWAEGGGAGVQALGPALPTPPAPMAAAEEAVERWRARSHPYESLRWEVWRNRVTVWWLVVGEDRSDVERRPLLQLRRSSTGRWHLYARAAHGEWWPVVVRGPWKRQTVDDCLAAVDRDPANRFWSPEPAAPPDGGR